MFRKVRVGAIPTRNSKPVIQFVDRERKISVSYNFKTCTLWLCVVGWNAEVSFFDAKFFIYHKRKNSVCRLRGLYLKLAPESACFRQKINALLEFYIANACS